MDNGDWGSAFDPRVRALAKHIVNLGSALGGVAGISPRECDDILAALKAVKGLTAEGPRCRALAWIQWDADWEREHHDEIENA